MDSSKLESHKPVHGGRGTFLASLSAMSLLSITSHHRLHRSHNSMSMHRSQIVSRQIPAPAQEHLPYFEHGTRIIVRDLFGNMPVRVKQRAMTSEKQGGNIKDWEDVKRGLVVLILAWPTPVSVTLREDGTNSKLTIRSPDSEIEAGGSISKVCSVLLQALMITSRERSSWVPVNASTSKLRICGAISLEPWATKHTQFLSFGVQPLISPDGQSILHSEINRLFQNSAFGNVEELQELDDIERTRRANDSRYKEDRFTSKELRGRKGVDRWPKFYINIQPKIPTRNNLNDFNVDTILDNRENGLQAVIELLQAMILEFLTKSHFRPNHVRSEASIAQNRTEAQLDTSHGKRDASTPSVTQNRRKSPHQLTNADLLGANIKLPSFRAIR